MIKRLISKYWGTDRCGFRPMAIFNIYCYFAADNYTASLIRNEPDEYIAKGYKNKKTLLLYASLLNLRGNLGCWLFGWWWVDNQKEKTLTRELEQKFNNYKAKEAKNNA